MADFTMSRSKAIGKDFDKGLASLRVEAEKG